MKFVTSRFHQIISRLGLVTQTMCKKYKQQPKSKRNSIKFSLFTLNKRQLSSRVSSIQQLYYTRTHVMTQPKWLSHYLFSFPFISFNLWTHEKEQLRRDTREFINRSKHKACISSVPQSNRNSIKFSLSTQTRRVIKSSQAKSLQLNYLSVAPYYKIPQTFTLSSLLTGGHHNYQSSPQPGSRLKETWQSVRDCQWQCGTKPRYYIQDLILQLGGAVCSLLVYLSLYQPCAEGPL